MTHFWLRAETKAGEARTPITPKTAENLMEAGHIITVELSGDRCFRTSEFASIGCNIEPAGSWISAPGDAVIIGIKELPSSSDTLSHRHIHFGHAFKNQPGWQEFLDRFKRGGGVLFDLENLVDDTGRRLAAFGYWAGYAGAAVGTMIWAGQVLGRDPVIEPLNPFVDNDAMLAKLRSLLADCGSLPTSLITGALGRCGSGAADLFGAVGIAPTKWDIAETASGGPFPEIAQHDIFLNCVLAAPGIPVFVEPSMLQDEDRKLSVISDVSCDPGSAYNPIPIYDKITYFSAPALEIESAGAALHVTAIDHLPSLLPVESSEDYASQLLPVLLDFDVDKQSVWARAEAVFHEKLGEI